MAALPAAEVEFSSVTVDASGAVTATPPGRATRRRQDLGHGVSLDLVQIPGGQSLIGSPRGVGFEDEYPQHSVHFQPFLLGQYPLTQAQWQAVAGKLPPCRFAGPDRPVENVTSDEAQRFCQRLSKQTGRAYRLPSEAQWEYACRAGSMAAFAFGPTLTSDLANYAGQHVYAGGPVGVYRHVTTPVGSFPPNAFGVYDMHGEVWEWCADAWHADYRGAPAEGSVVAGGGDAKLRVMRRVIRGGSWHDTPDSCRSAVRGKFPPGEGEDYIGFRVLLMSAE
jgi:formylglycine-generating enzyme required for sulfatase activity